MQSLDLVVAHILHDQKLKLDYSASALLRGYLAGKSLRNRRFLNINLSA